MTEKEAPVSGDVVTLEECPPGPFLFDGILGFKTEYRAMETVYIPGGEIRWQVGLWPDAYVMASGEFFWGGAKSHAERAALLVQPVDVTATPPSPASAQPDEDVVLIAARAICAQMYAADDLGQFQMDELVEMWIPYTQAALTAATPLIEAKARQEAFEEAGAICEKRGLHATAEHFRALAQKDVREIALPTDIKNPARPSTEREWG